MTVTTEITPYSFFHEAWSGAKDTLDDLTVKEVELIFSILEDGKPENGYSLTDINDFFWFERDLIAEWLGYEDYDALMNDR